MESAITAKQRCSKLLANIGDLVLDENRDAEDVAKVLQIVKDKKDFMTHLGLRQFRSVVPASKTSNFIVRVDRMIHLAYPCWVKELVHPELECTGPMEFSLSKVELWLYDGQKWRVNIQAIYNYLKETDNLSLCLSLQDGLVIQKMGIGVFRKFFKGKAIFLWKSVVWDRHNHLQVPRLREVDSKVVINWFPSSDEIPATPRLRLSK